MKILCPVDFSNSSVNALHYALEVFKSSPSLEVTLIHCFNLASRSGMFIKMDDILRERAEKDMATLMEKKEASYPNVKFAFQIYKGDPKYIIPAYEKKHDFDFVVIGSTGMSELKDIVIGSLTETMFEESDTPIIAVPNDITVEPPKQIMVALDDKVIENPKIFGPLRKLVQENQGHLHLCHVKRGEAENSLEYDPVVDVELAGLDYSYTLIDKEGKLADILDDHAKEINADMVTFIHRHRTWWQRLFSRSQTKEELYHLNSPMLILNGDIEE